MASAPSPTDFFCFFDETKKTHLLTSEVDAKAIGRTSSFFIKRPKGEAKRICAALRSALVTHAIQTRDLS